MVYDLRTTEWVLAVLAPPLFTQDQGEPEELSTFQDTFLTLNASSLPDLACLVFYGFVISLSISCANRSPST